MQTSVFRLWSISLLLLVTAKGIAQQQDSLLLVSHGKLVQMDSIFLTSKGIKIEPDSIYIGKGTLNVVNGNIYHVSNDTLPDQNIHKTPVISDSIYKKKNIFYVRKKVFHVQKDSLFYKRDSLNRKSKLFKSRQDSLFRKQAIHFRKTKSLQFKQDSLNSLRKSVRSRFFSKAQLYRLDSLKSLNWRKDSARIRIHLEKLKINLKQMKEDSVRQITNMHKKIISMEVACDKNDLVSIGNMGRKIIIKNTDEGKVKIETTIFAAAGFDEKELNMEKVLNISLEKKKNEVLLKTSDSAGVTFRNANNTGSAVVKVPLLYKINNRSPLIIHVPAGAKLTIKSRYNDVTIMDNVTAVNLDLINTNLQMQDANNAVIKSRYGSVKAGNIKDADIDLLNCSFISGNLEKLLINSKYSDVKFENSDAADIKSVSDQYKIATANYITANKSFGKLDIAKLETSIVLTGSSADMDIRAIDASARLIQVDNKYAEIKLPVENLLNYSLQFDGINSNVFTTSDKMDTPVSGSSIQPNPATFTKTMGDSKSAITSLLVNCASCLVDFR
jgi:hypothetical protein